MIKGQTEFPNPILQSGTDDYIKGCSFATAIDGNHIVVTADTIDIPVSYDLVSQGLNQLIRTDKAVVLIHVKSQALSYSRVFLFPKDERQMTLHIPKCSVAKELEIGGVIVSTVANHHFDGAGEFNPLYFADAVFSVGKGDMLAVEEPYVMRLKEDELAKPLSSIFLINKSDDIEDDIMPDFEGDKIEINVSPAVYTSYCQLAQKGSESMLRFASAILIFPVLVEALTIVRDKADSYSDKRWYRAIRAKLDSRGIAIEDEQSLVSVANVLLGNITDAALSGFRKAWEYAMEDSSDMTGGDG